MPLYNFHFDWITLGVFFPLSSNKINFKRFFFNDWPFEKATVMQVPHFDSVAGSHLLLF